jgi:hypothetical protein
MIYLFKYGHGDIEWYIFLKILRWWHIELTRVNLSNLQPESWDHDNHIEKK